MNPEESLHDFAKVLGEDGDGIPNCPARAGVSDTALDSNDSRNSRHAPVVTRARSCQAMSDGLI